MREKIISASRRTDIPAFYTPWFMNRIRDGFCVYPNPLYPAKFYRVSLRKEDVLGIVFWTRNALPLLPHLAELDKKGFPYYFQYTIVGYPKSLDLHSPSLTAATKTFCELSKLIGKHRVIWRYDPIVFNQELTPEWHQSNFKTIADALSGATNSLVVSVIDPYARTRRRVGSQEDGVSYLPDDYLGLLRWIATECAGRGISVQTCAEAAVDVDGMSRGGCVDARILFSLAGRQAPAKLPLHKQREGCLCHQSVDIGVNDTCGFGCKYCYATTSHAKAADNLKRHNPEWTCITQDVHLDPPPETPEQLTLM